MNNQISHSKNMHHSSRKVFWRPKPTRDKYSDMVLTSSMSHMLIEDIHTGIIPFSYDSYDSRSQVRFTNYSKAVEDAIIDALPNMYGKADDLRSAVCGFIRYASHVLAAYGECICEIVYYYDENDQNKPIGFEFSHIPYDVVKRAFGNYFYRLVKEGDLDNPATEGKMKRIDSSYIFHLRIPDKYGSPASYRRKMSKLAKFSQSVVPEFAIEDLRIDYEKKVFDFDSYRRSLEKWVAGSTKDFGWTARGTFRETTTEYFRLLRHLRFRKYQSSLREHILNELNAALERIGRHMDFATKIEMDDLPDVNTYNTLFSKLEDGRLPFMDAWNAK